MMKLNIVFLLICTLLCYLYASDYLYIHSDVANIRENKSGKVIDRLDINTKVEVIEHDNVWFLIRYSGNGEGWVNKVVLGDTYLSEKNILDSIRTTGTEKVKWAERLVHAYPRNKENWTRLLEFYKDYKDTNGIERVNKYLKGLSSVFIAKCKCGEIQLQGELDSSGHFSTNIFIYPICKYTENAIDSAQAELFFLKYQLAHTQWYSSDGKVDMERFSAPEVETKRLGSYCLKTDNDWESEDPEFVYFLSLGKGTGDSIYCTSPMSHVNWKNINRVIDDSCLILDGLTKNVIDESYYDTILKPCSFNVITDYCEDVGLFEIEAKALCNREGYPVTQFVNALFNYKGERVYPQNRLSEIWGPKYGNKNDRFLNTPFFILEKIHKNKAYNIGSYTDEEMGTTNSYYHEDFLMIDRDGKCSCSEIVNIHGPG